MNAKNKTLIFSGLVISLWTIAMMVVLRFFPPVYFDEIEYANHAFNFICRHVLEFSLYDNLYPKEFYAIRHAWPPLIRPFYVWLLALSFRLNGVGVVAARVPSVLAGALLLWLVAVCTNRLTRNVGSTLLAVAALAVHPYFLMTSAFARPEIFLTLCAVVCVFLFMWSMNRRNIYSMGLVGFVAALSIGVHTNGIVLLAALTLLWIPYRGKDLFRDPALLVFFIGALTGLFIFVSVGNWDQFLPGVRFMMLDEFNRPPILNFAHPFSETTLAVSRFFKPWVFGDSKFDWLWRQAQAMWWTLSFVAVLQAMLHWKKTRKFSRLALLGWFMTFFVICFVLFVGAKAPSYTVIFLPFSAMLVGAWAHTIFRIGALNGKRRSSLFVRSVPVMLVAFYIVACVIFVFTESRERPRYAELVKRLRSQIPPHSSVIGPMIFWLEMSDTEYRDIGALMWHRLLRNESNLSQHLNDFPAQFVILDEAMARRFYFEKTKPDAPPKRGPTNLIAQSHRILDVIPAGRHYGQRLILLEIERADNR